MLVREFWISGTGFQSFLVEHGFWIPILSGIPDSLSCIPDSKTQDSGFHKENIYQIPESGFPYMGWQFKIEKSIVFLRSQPYTADKSDQYEGRWNVHRTWSRWDERISTKREQKSETKDWDSFNWIKIKIIYKE